MFARRIFYSATALVALTAGLWALDTRQAAPKFSAKSLEGEKFNNDSLKGKVVLVQFWTTWCPHCRADQAAVDALADEYAGQGLVVLGVDVAESRQKVKDYLRKTPRSSNIVLNEDTNLPAVFEAKSFPLYVAIDRDGKIADKHSGEAHEDGLRSMLKKAGLKIETDRP